MEGVSERGRDHRRGEEKMQEMQQEENKEQTRGGYGGFGMGSRIWGKQEME